MSRLSDADVFSRVVRAGGFSAAARELGVTQSALSRRVAALEARLAVRLLARSARGVAPTDAGRLYHEAAERALGELDAAERSVAATAEEPQGTLRVHLPPAFGRARVVPVLGRFAALHPRLRVHVTLADRVVDLAAERGDVAVRIGRLREKGLVARRIGETRAVPCASPDYVARRGAPRTPAALARHDALLLAIYAPREAWVLEPVSGAGRGVRVPLRPRLVSNDVETLVALACAGLGVAALPDFLADDLVRRGALVRLLPRHRLPATPIHVVFPERRHRSRAARAFADFLADALGARAAR